MLTYAADVTAKEVAEVCGYVKRIPPETLRRMYFAVLADRLASDVEDATENTARLKA